MQHDISQHWSGGTIMLSYCISVTGSYCTIQLMEQWRAQDKPKTKIVLLMLSAFTLGGCGIWCTHFTGMRALNMQLNDGTILDVDFEGGMTILSLIFPVVGVFVGLNIASKDPFFLEMEASKRKDLLTKNLKNMRMEDMIKKKSQMGKKIKFIALFSRLWRIIFGGLFAALGVLGMHYLGMMAQRMNAKMSFDAGIVALSSIIAFGTANAAFWILFRALTFWPGYEALRMGSALIMGVAVCGTHYSGMGAASYEFSEENYQDRTKFLLRGAEASTVASHASLLICFWLSTFAVVVSLRKEIRNSERSRNNNTTAQKSQANKTSKAPMPGQSGRFSESPGSQAPGGNPSTAPSTSKRNIDSGALGPQAVTGMPFKGHGYNAVVPAPGPTAREFRP